MPLISRRSLLLAKIESVYGTDPTPTGAANAVVAYNMNLTPLEMALVSRELVLPYMGNFDQLFAAGYGMLDFEVEIAGAGTAGTAPGYGALLRACGMSQALNASAVAGTAAAGAAATITLAAGASASDDAYNGMVIRITGGTGAGQRRLVNDYVGSTKVATVNKPWDTAPNGTSTYSIDAAAYYAPVSSGHESATLYFYKDGVLHEMNGARGSVSFGLSRLNRPTMRFRFTGLYVPVVDAATPTPTVSAFQQPLVVNNTNTSGFSLHGYASWVLDSLALDIGNVVTYRHLVGSETVQITDRRPAGSVMVEAVTVAQKDIFANVRSVLQDELTIKHGLNAGNIVYLDAPNVQAVNPRYSSQDGIEMLGLDLVLIPSASTAGNDDLYLTVA